MLTVPIVPIESNRKQITSCHTDNYSNSLAPNNISINENTANALIPGNNLTISAVVSCASSTCSSSSSGKKRPRTSLSSSYEDDEATIAYLQSIKPSDYARAAFKANGFGDVAAIQKDCETRFLPPTASMLEAYNTEILDAVRSNNLERAKSLYREGRHPQGCNACNRFGESILHIACRRGHLEMVRFLVDEVGLSCATIRDDYHRTPLHDAFWTATANPDVVAFLMEQPHVTELLMCPDKRGFTPLDYSRGEDRGRWLRFLWERRSELRPTEEDGAEPDCHDDEIRRSDYGCDQLKETTSNKRIKLIG